MIQRRGCLILLARVRSWPNSEAQAARFSVRYRETWSLDKHKKIKKDGPIAKYRDEARLGENRIFVGGD